MKILLENVLSEPTFLFMVDLSKARAASNRLLNGLTVEIRLVDDDVIYGYEGLSYSGCNIWAYSTKQKQGFLTFSNDEDAVYGELYGHLGYQNFDVVPQHSQQSYNHFIANYDFTSATKAIPEEYIGNYHRVKINDKDLKNTFALGRDYMLIRAPEETRYDLMYYNNNYHVKGKDRTRGSVVHLYQTQRGNRFLSFEGTLYVKCL